MNDRDASHRQDLEALRELLFSEELEELDRLRSQLDDSDEFGSRVGQVLPQAMLQSAEQSDEMSEALLPTVEDIVRLSIRKDINRFADALFPVIGPAIRKAIRESIRQMLQSLNRSLELSLSVQGFKWRLQSLRTGIPFAQIVLLHGLVYRVEQVFLIHRDSGVLLLEARQEDIQARDPDLVSAMLSAINDFVSDSFAQEAENQLGGIEVGELSIWVEAGPDAILAAAIRGEAPQSLRSTLQRTLERIQGELAEAFDAFEGVTAPFEVCGDLLSDCLQARYREEKKGIPWKLVLVAALLVIGVGYGMFIAREQERLRSEYLAALDREPGIVVTNVSEQNSQLVIKGMRDPLARPIEVLVEDAKITPDKVTHQLEPYLSLQGPIIEQRARQLLNPPAGVELSLKNGLLVFVGVADSQWRELLGTRVAMIAGVAGFDDSGLRTGFTTALLNPPEGVSLRLESGILSVEGAAANDWIRLLDAVPEHYPEVAEVDRSGLVNLSEMELVEKIEAMESLQVFFDTGSSSGFEALDTVRIGAVAREIIDLAETLSRGPLIVVNGYSDSVGQLEDNRILSLERAEFVAQFLYDAGIKPHYVIVKGHEPPAVAERSVAERRFNRRVEFEVIME